MTLEQILQTIVCKGQVGDKYAYANYSKSGWLIRVHKTPSGNAIFDYSTPCNVFEGNNIAWMKFGRLDRGELSNNIRGLDYSLTIPVEWIKPTDVIWPQDISRECRFCLHCFRKGSSYCIYHHTYTSSLMSCPSFAPRSTRDIPEYEDEDEGLG